MKKSTLLFALMLILSAGLTSCGKDGCTDPTASNYDSDAKDDDGSCEYDNQSITGELTASTTWTADRIWMIQGKVVVPDGVTLTIEAGTIVKAAEGQDAQAAALIVARGGKLMAQGTASNPIIFTSALDNIQAGQLVGSNLEREDNQLWGGIVILGNAPVSAENGDDEGNIEGINPDDDFGKYGGSDATDNSGILSYVSIRHCGISIGEGNEINALTLGGVGSGTTINNIEVYATLDDGIECFGGTVNIENALVYYQGDDGIDIDQNYAGTINNFAVIHGDGIGTDEGLEIDGPEGTATDGFFTLSNGICKTEGMEGSAADFKSKAQGQVTNVTFEYGSAPVKIRASFDESCGTKSDALTNLISGGLSFTNCDLSGGVDVYENADEATCTDEVTAAQTAAEEKIDNGTGSTINISELFGNWTAAGQRNQL